MKKTRSSMKITSMFLALIMLAGALGAFSLTVSGEDMASPETWGEYKVTDNTYTHADFSPFVEGNGDTEGTAYEIDSPEKLAGLAALVNRYSSKATDQPKLTGVMERTATATNFAGKYIKLTADIDLSGYEWVPIGTDNAIKPDNEFKGIFDGGGYTISGLWIGSEGQANETYKHAGLFGYVTEGTIKNVGVSGLINVAYSDSAYTGGLVGTADKARIENCYNTCSVSGTTVGGLVGRALSGCTITNCYSVGSVSGTTTAGGFVGTASGAVITNCYSVGGVSGTTTEGGFAGSVGNGGITVSNCFWYATDDLSKAIGSGDSNGSLQKLTDTQMKAFAGEEGAFVDALNAWVTANQTNDEAYREWHRCSPYPHLGSSSECKLCWIRITGASISIGQDLTMKYYVKITDDPVPVGEGEKLAMQFTMNGKTETVYANEARSDDGEYVFEFKRIAPQCMADLIDATLIVEGENGETVKTLASKEGYSVRDNAEALLDRYPDDEALTQLVVDMLAYGAAAQNYRDHNTENLANKFFPSEFYPVSGKVPEKSDNTITPSTSGTAYFTAATVWFDNVNKIGIKLSTTKDVKLIVKIGEDTVGTTYENLKDTTFYTDAIYATDFDTVYTFELYEGDTLVQTLTYSVASYVHAMMDKEDGQGNPTEMAELAKALYGYGASAKAYRDAKEVTVVTNAEELNEKLNAGGNVQLGGDIDLGETYVSMTEAVEAVLDLNGHTITSELTETIGIFSYKAHLIVMDSSNSQEGAINNDNASGSGILNRGTLTVESGTVRSLYWGVHNYGTVNLNGGTIRGGEVGIRNEGGIYVNDGGELIDGVEEETESNE